MLTPMNIIDLGFTQLSDEEAAVEGIQLGAYATFAARLDNVVVWREVADHRFQVSVAQGSNMDFYLVAEAAENSIEVENEQELLAAVSKLSRVDTLIQDALRGAEIALSAICEAFQTPAPANPTRNRAATTSS